MRRLFSSPLSRSFAMMVIAASTLITIFITSVQLWIDYRISIDSVERTVEQVQISYMSALASSVWTFDHGLVRTQLEGITNLPEIEWVELITEDGSRWSAGDPGSVYKLTTGVPLVHDHQVLGQLILHASLDRVYWALATKFGIILGLNLIKTLAMVVVIIFLFYRIVGRHLIDLAGYLSSLSLDRRAADFALRDKKRQNQPDELDQLAASMNVMHGKIRSSYDDIAKFRDDLEAALNKERELSGLQRQFVSMVSHEFRTPLAIIDGNAQRLLRRIDKVTPDKLADVMGKMRVSVHRLTELMESMLSAARLEDGRIEFDPGECDIRTLIEETCSGYRELNRDHQFILDIDRLPAMISADQKLLRQVISNLVSNAIKYAPDGRRIWITAREDPPDHVRIAVRDEGIGIPEDELEMLFGRFFRASTSTGIPGSGIGLHLVKHLIDLHGGEVGVESREGEGTTFVVRLPRTDSARPSPAVEKPVGDAGRLQPALIGT
ncbi:MAG: ATP-binding protein [Geminicoccaceae bacterium]